MAEPKYWSSDVCVCVLATFYSISHVIFLFLLDG